MNVRNNYAIVHSAHTHMHTQHSTTLFHMNLKDNCTNRCKLCVHHVCVANQWNHSVVPIMFFIH